MDASVTILNLLLSVDGVAGSWSIVAPGAFKDLNVYAQAGEMNTLMVLDIGSNSIKLVIYDLSTSPPKVIQKYDDISGLAEGMSLDSKKAKLNRGNVRKILRKVAPAIQEIIKEHKPKGFLIMCTEAVRAAIESGRYTGEAEDFLKDFAQKISCPQDGLLIPRKAFNVISPELEAILAAGTAICAGHEDGDVLMLGGGSLEVARIKKGKLVEGLSATLHIGTRRLFGLRKKLCTDLIERGFDSIPWFNSKGGDMLLAGGGFRVVGRALAQRIYKVPFNSKLPEHKFANDMRLDEELERLTAATYESLFEDSFGARRMRDLQRVIIEEGKRKYVYIKYKDLEGRQIWMKKNDFNKLHNAWKTKIGRRAKFIRSAAKVLLEAKKRRQPDNIIFLNAHTMREAGLWRLGLAYVKKVAISRLVA